MNDLECQLKMAKKVTMTEEEKNNVMITALQILGNEKYIIISIEEISEFIQCLTKILRGNKPSLHTIEEMVDTQISLFYIEQMFSLNNIDWNSITDTRMTTSNNIVKQLIYDLTSLSSVLSTVLIQKDLPAYRTIVLGMVEFIKLSINQFIITYKLDKSDINAMYLAKILRTKKRIESDNLK